MGRTQSSNLDGTDLSRARLYQTKLIATDLSRANIYRMIIKSANLSGTNLSGADISRTDLSGAGRRGANLSGTNLSGAFLHRTNLTGVSLREANLRSASCESTVFAGVDLSDVTGLDEVRHDGPSTIGTDTLVHSKAKIPDSFLRGCGLPDVLISYVPILVGSMSPTHFLFVLHQLQLANKEFAERLYADLQAKGIRNWFAQEPLKIGDRFRQGYGEPIAVHNKLLLVLSEPSVASDWVEGEVEAALKREKWEMRTVLFPIRLDDSVLETPIGWASHIRQTRHIGDFCQWKDHEAYHQSFDRLFRDLQASEGDPG